MQIDWWTLGLQAVNVLILVWLLSRFLYRPVLNAIEARQQAAESLLAEAQAQKDAAAAEASTADARARAFEAESGKRRAEMHAAIEGERARMLASVKAEAEAITAQGHAAAVAEKARMTAELEAQAGILAGRMAERLLQRLPAATVSDLLFEALLGRIGELAPEERERLAKDEPLVLSTPEPLAPETQARCLARLGEALARPVQPAFAADPALIAGFELHGPHMRVSNSWRADLDRMLQALKEDGNARLEG